MSTFTQEDAFTNLDRHRNYTNTILGFKKELHDNEDA